MGFLGPVALVAGFWLLKHLLFRYWDIPPHPGYGRPLASAKARRSVGDMLAHAVPAYGLPGHLAGSSSVVSAGIAHFGRLGRDGHDDDDDARLPAPNTTPAMRHATLTRRMSAVSAGDFEGDDPDACYSDGISGSYGHGHGGHGGGDVYGGGSGRYPNSDPSVSLMMGMSTGTSSGSAVVPPSGLYHTPLTLFYIASGGARVAHQISSLLARRRALARLTQAFYTLGVVAVAVVALVAYVVMARSAWHNTTALLGLATPSAGLPATPAATPAHGLAAGWADRPRPGAGWRSTALRISTGSLFQGATAMAAGGHPTSQDPTGRLVVTLLPGVTIPLAAAGHYVTALLVSGCVHELGHAVAAAAEAVPVMAAGMSLVVFYPGAFVDLSVPALRALRPLNQIRIACGGVWHNLVLAAGIMAALAALPAVASALGGGYTRLGPLDGDAPSGVAVIEVDRAVAAGAPVAAGVIIRRVNGLAVRSLDDWEVLLAAAATGQLGMPPVQPLRPAGAADTADDRLDADEDAADPTLGFCIAAHELAATAQAADACCHHDPASAAPPDAAAAASGLQCFRRAAPDAPSADGDDDAGWDEATVSSHVCFPLLHAVGDAPAAPPDRDEAVSAAWAPRCRRAAACPRPGDACLQLDLQATRAGGGGLPTERLLVLELAVRVPAMPTAAAPTAATQRRTVAFLGQPKRLYAGVRVGTLWARPHRHASPSGWPYVVERWLHFTLSLTLGLAFLNALPAHTLDGEHVLDVVVQSLVAQQVAPQPALATARRAIMGSTTLLVGWTMLSGALIQLGAA
ncbi:hypothetical protein CXG81DRAFT_23266 [Caulochytrium protostelioides]|uniref:Endopeptidase S2P n=1 Tax=Caulochytrium protostelioides TaxID=1555241 RepID=A0A4P9XG59_9FUNG|nr:hypothetical protein CXG81DRAFT_23266 [Caulochytrium protostelioides]|eukprot:RKP04160.1 hypothetical protein CXG81DRAFT_23266 [Caulochytrium protostelioides]